jgi:UDP-N-acetylmuramoylalanine--D-glutamate ligase
LKNAVVTVCDAREIVAQEAAAQELKERITWQLGPEYLAGLSSFDCIMRSPGVRIMPEIKVAVAAGVKLTSPTAEFFEMCPAKIIGVTGTKGKGTTASLIAEIIKASGRTVHLVGNIGAPAIAALATIKADDFVVYELSSFQLQDLSVSPTIAVVLGITAEHQDYHSSMAEYVAAKANILRHQHENDIAIITVDYTANEPLAQNECLNTVSALVKTRSSPRLKESKH